MYADIKNICMKIQAVDKDGNTIEEIEKLAAHENGGVWHRAISVFLFDQSGRLLIQKRSAGKYHFAGLWANSCCSHPSVAETPEQAAWRAMLLELGVSAKLTEVGVVRYEATDSISGHTEREHDHIFVGEFDGIVSANPEEVELVRLIDLEMLKMEIQEDEPAFAPWLPAILRSGVLSQVAK